MKRTLGDLSLRKSPRKRNTLLTILSIVVVLTIAGVVVFVNKKAANNNVDNGISSEAKLDKNSEKGLPGSDYATGASNNSVSENAHNDSDSPPPPETGTPAIEISSFSQQGDTITTRATLLNISSAGKCVFTFSKEGEKTVTKETTRTGKVCEVSAKSSEFSKLDIWTLNVAFYNGSRKVVDTTVNVTIN